MDKVNNNNIFMLSGKEATKSTDRSSKDLSRISSRWKEASTRARPRDDGSKRSGTSKRDDGGDELEVKKSPFDLYNQLQATTNSGKDEILRNEELLSELRKVGLSSESFVENIDLDDEEDVVYAMVQGNHHSQSSLYAGSDFTVNGAEKLVYGSSAAEKAAEVSLLLEKMVDHIGIMKSQGVTETTLTLKDVGVFDGAKLTITQVDSATKQLNIKFENMSQEAHKLIIRNQESLKAALDTKLGLTVHIVTATTEVEKPVQVYEGAMDERRDGQNASEEQQRQQQDRR